MAIEQRTDIAHNGYTWRSFSWGAILAGLVVAFAVYLTLNLLGAGVGITTFGGEETSGKAVGIGSGIWWFLVGVISLYLGGWVAGTLSGAPLRVYRILHGAAVWGLMYLISVYLLTTALAGLVGGTASMLGQTLQTAGAAFGKNPALQQALRQFGVEPGNLKQQVKDAVGAPEMTDENVTNIANAVQQYLRTSRSPQDRQQLTQVVAQNSGKSPEEINPMIQQWEQRYEQTKQQAFEGAEKAASVTGTTAIILSIVMFIGLIAASVGAALACGPFCEKHVHTT